MVISNQIHKRYLAGKMSKKPDQRETFETWVTFLDDRIDEWKEPLSEEIQKALDYSPQSLNVLEEYVLQNYTRESFKDDSLNFVMDAMVSYMGETLRSNLPDSFWQIELDDESDFNYALPSLKVPTGPAICPHILFKRLLAKRKGDFLYNFYKLRLGFIENPETY
jgi:hypothetical protein